MKLVLKNKYFEVYKEYIKSNDKKIKILIVKPIKNKKDVKDTPGILWLHGGGYATGMAEMLYFTRAISLVKKYGAVLVVPNYTLSIKKPYPYALYDCYNALLYLKNHAKDLSFNDSKIMVGGESAGGGLTVALCLYARDKKEVNISFQMPLYPMIDNRPTESNIDNHAKVWNTKRNIKAWNMYLKGVKYITKYAVPALEKDYTNLPACYTYVGDLEPFLSETITYIDNLKKANVEANIDIYKNWYHAYDLYFPYKKKSREAIKKFEKAYLEASIKYSAKQS
ncbi:MAG: alpha/beta hydrolase fold domain-containing protein [Bacilli bacterium]|nr:alpha/beta hydrolase fold domain-containing protein [Bacilli bacterium]